jgi:hypothetical protein
MEKKVEIIVAITYPLPPVSEWILGFLTLGISDFYFEFKRAGRHKLVLYTDDTLELIKNDEEVISSEVVDSAQFLAKIKHVKRVGKIKTVNRIACRFNKNNVTYFS